ncbi:prion-like-(Q/N-rich) domain-bearing protein 25 [Mercenaria mercenaria]|uniref:prion-like-(Q/N-rich) domain-bearing protein 25 n=1 Tax=Mercenaria mercenaria TaxID=6596 RepID=UPI00234F9F34|nr:prion-like-(Q/N-rich) domain-bearing protein 25 [Mercenaria mercenaria]
MNQKCVYDETYGGICKNWSGDCALDKNAECIHGICQCKYGTREVSGKCVTDETAGGICIEDQGQECLLDSNALCLNGSCVCKKGTHQIGQKCQKDGSLRGVCRAGNCEGENVTCSIKTKLCVCKTGYVESRGKCMK